MYELAGNHPKRATFQGKKFIVHITYRTEDQSRFSMQPLPFQVRTRLGTVPSIVTWASCMRATTQVFVHQHRPALQKNRKNRNSFLFERGLIYQGCWPVSKFASEQHQVLGNSNLESRCENQRTLSSTFSKIGLQIDLSYLTCIISVKTLQPNGRTHRS